MGLPGFLSFTVLVVLVAYIASFLDVEPVAYAPPAPPPFTGPLQTNTLLEKTEKLFEGQLSGPESIAFYKGVLYTSLTSGEIVKVVDNKLQHVAYTGKPQHCVKAYTEHLCGRPLGLRFGHKDDLYVADSYFGLLRVNVTSGEVNHLFSASEPINGKFAKLTDDLDITKEGDIYFSDASTKFLMKEAMIDVAESAPNGRLLHYDPRTQSTKEILTNRFFPNGVQLSKDQDYLLFSESTRSRIMKFYLKGPKKFTVELFADNLPGFPDNIRANGRGGYWVALCGTRHPEKINVGEVLGPYPLVRKTIARILYVIGRLFATVDTLIPNDFCKNVAHVLPHLCTAPHYLHSYGLVVEISDKGQIIRSLHSPTGQFQYFSHVHEHQGNLYLGSPWNNYLGKLKL